MKIFCIVILVSKLVCTSSMVDEFMSCDRLFGDSGEGAKARSARHLLEAIPCDMKKQSFCAHKGSAYPEAAIWRFKEENRALMRRLYGDMESTTLYREMRSTAEKSSKNFQPSNNPLNSKTNRATKSKQSRSSPILLPHIARSPDGATPLFSTLDYNIRIGSGLATVQGAKDNVMNSRLATRLGGGRLKIKKKVLKKRKNPTLELAKTNSSILQEKPQHHVIFNSKTSSVTSTPVDSSPIALELKEILPNENSGSYTEEQETTTVTVSTTSTVSSVSVKASTSEAPTIQPTTLSPSTMEGDITETTNLIYPTTTMDNENLFTTDTVPILTDFTTLDGSATSQGEITETEFSPMESRVGSLEDGLIKVVDSSTPSKVSDDVTTHHIQEEVIESEVENAELNDSIETVCTILQKILENAGMTRSCEEILKMMAETDSLKLFENEEMETTETPTAQAQEDEIDYIDDSIYSGASTSACPVRREVVSPYWANNTRQQTLALLNIYPFEQYVHMEMCKYEHHEMLCRPGCKCEQQYRMHRLLAFDPSNECRGIFSDWFELPSFCVCKCYESITENFIPRPRRKPRIELDINAADTLIDVGKEKNSRAQKTVLDDQNLYNPIPNSEQHVSDGRSFQNIPAILPYEAKLALLKEIRHRDNRNLLKSLKVLNSAMVESKTPKPLHESAVPTNLDSTHNSAEQEKGNPEIIGQNKDTNKNTHIPNIGTSAINIDNEKTNHQEKQNKGNFLYNIRYGNLPVMEFKLPDGSSGTVDKVPR